MATITKVRRVANPRKKRATGRFRALRNKKGRFVKLSKTRKRTTAPAKRRKKSNPVRRRVVTRKTHRRRSNPVLIELAGLAGLNPRKRSKKLAKRKYRRNPKATTTRRRRRTRAVVRRVVRRRRRNPVAAAPVRRRRRYTRRRSAVAMAPVRRRRRTNGRRRRMSIRRRNPVFGQTGGKNMLLMVGGGLVGVAATKFLPTLIPASLTSSLGSSPLASIAITGAGAFAAGWLAKRFGGETFGNAVLFGGLMQTGSAILTAFAPGALSQFALSGMGDIMPGYFAVPQNPITNRAPTPMVIAPSGKGGVSGFGPGGFGYRRSM